MELASLPPNPSDPYRKAVARWSAMYNRPVDLDTYSPNYARWFGGLIAGLMQAKPPTATPDIDEGVDLPELVEETSEEAAAVGVCFLRPVFDGTQFTVAAVPATRVEAMWAHKRLEEAYVWEIRQDPTDPDDRARKVALIEHWLPEGGVEFRFAVGSMDPGRDAMKIDKLYPVGQVPDKYADMRMVQGAINDGGRFGDLQGADWLRLSGFVWRWHQGHPAPIYASNERLIYGLERLWDQEQVDAEMIRNRLAVDEQLVKGTNVVYGPDGQPTTVGGGFKLSDQVMVVKGVSGAQSLEQNRLFEVVTFPDHLTMRERIERRENTALEMLGISPQTIGRSVSGRSDSAAAKRADQQMTINTVSTPGRRLARCLSDAASVVNRLNGGTEVEVAVFPGPRAVPMESAQEAAVLAGAEAASTETLVRTAHPDWPDPDVNAEVLAIQGENRRAAAPEEWGSVPDDASDLDTMQF